MRYLITGGCGFLGANLAQEVLARGEELIVLDNLSRVGTTTNLTWLRRQGDFRFVREDIRHAQRVEALVRDVRPDVIFHLAGQVAMTTSLKDPRLDFETNVIGTFNLLDAVRLHAPEAFVAYSSTNKVYGDLEWVNHTETSTRYVSEGFPDGFDEETPFKPTTPYGVSKGAADQYMQDFSRMFGLRTVVFRHSSMYGGQQFATVDQGWVGWFCQKALEFMAHRCEAVVIAGNGKQVRDLLHADDMRSLYFAAAERSDAVAGQVFNIGGGMAHSLSLLELFSLLGRITGRAIRIERAEPRVSDQKVFVADTAKARKALAFAPVVTPDEGVAKMLAWLSAI